MENQVNNAAAAAQGANVQNAEEQKVQNVEQSTESMQLSVYDKIVADLIKKNKLYKNYKIKSCKCTPKENYNLISFTLDKKIKGYTANDNGEFVENDVNLIFTSNFAISGAIRENENLAWLRNIITDNPRLTELLLIGATIDIIQETVVAGEEYKNPFSTYLENTTYFDHDTYINHVINIRLSKQGEKVANALMDKLLEQAISTQNNVNIF